MATRLQVTGDVALNASSVSKAFASNVAQDSLIVVGASQFPSNVFVAGDCTKSAGSAGVGTIALDEKANSTGSQESAVGIWSCLVTAGGSATMRVGTVGGSFISIGEGEYSGSWDGSRLEDHQIGVDNVGSTTPTTANMTSAGAAVMFGALSVYIGINLGITKDAAWEDVFEYEDGTSGEPAAFEDRVVGSGTTDAASWTIASSAPYVAAGVTYKEVAAGGVPTGTSGGAVVGSPTSFVGEAMLGAIESGGGDVSVSLTGVSSASAVNAGAETGTAVAPLTGVSATSAIGTPSVSLVLEVPLTGVASTAAVNGPAVTGAAVVALTGVQATPAVAVPVVTGAAVSPLAGVASQSAIGAVTAEGTDEGSVNVPLAGVQVTAAVHDLAVIGSAIAALAGVGAASAVGTFAISCSATHALTGVAATGSVGTPGVDVRIDVALTGVGSTASVGVPVATGAATHALSGVAAIGRVGVITVPDNTTVAQGAYASKQAMVYAKLLDADGFPDKQLGVHQKLLDA